jgi:hypothetical protein
MREFSIIQNHALGALAIQSFAKEYYKQNKGQSGVIFPLIMPLLPIVFNERACGSLNEVKRITQTRFLTTLSDYRDIPAGLQSRMVDMADQTFKSLNLAFSLNLIIYQAEKGEIMPVRYSKKKIPALQYKDNQEILYASKVLGNWFAQYSIEEICISLNIVF